MPKSSLVGDVALITGANHGIGAATALALAHLGADVAITYFPLPPDPDRSDEYNDARSADGSATQTAIEVTGQRCAAIEADLSDVDTLEPLFDHIECALGPVSILVHNASGWAKDSYQPPGESGASRPQTPMVTAATVDSQLHVDARAGALLMAIFIERHRQRRARWGRIVALTSGEGRQYPGQVSYGAGKAALISYTLSAALEMAGDGVTANVVYPPVTDTGWITDEVRAFVEADFEHHHVADPAEVADVIAWLCSGAGRLVTGNIIRLR